MLYNFYERFNSYSILKSRASTIYSLLWLKCLARDVIIFQGLKILPFSRNYFSVIFPLQIHVFIFVLVSCFIFVKFSFHSFYSKSLTNFYFCVLRTISYSQRRCNWTVHYDVNMNIANERLLLL
jgi:hypothetical protein